MRSREALLAGWSVLLMLAAVVAPVRRQNGPASDALPLADGRGA